MIIFIFGLGIYLINYVNSESLECMASPLTYGVSKFKTDLGQIICYCNIKEEECNCPIPQTTNKIIVTKDSVSIIDTKFILQ